MSTVISRTAAATPKRSPSATWAVIVDILAPDASDPARAELARVASVGAAVIAAEAPQGDAIVMFGGGPRVRVYCAYGDDALLGSGVNEDAVRQSVTGDGWRLSLPCDADDHDWIRRKLESLSSRVTARKAGEDAPSAERDQSSASSQQGAATLNLGEFFKP